MKWSEIERFPRSNYCVDVSWRWLEENIARYAEDGLDLEPDYQRAHVWTMEQRSAYVEYMLRGGEVSRHIIFNCPGWSRGHQRTFTIVDGKQRLESARMFMRGEVPVFGGWTFQDFSGSFPFMIGFKFNIVELESRRELLKFYLSLNTGGTPHSKDEIERVKAMLLSHSDSDVLL